MATAMTSASLIFKCAAVALVLLVVAQYHVGEANHLSRFVTAS